MSKKIDCRVDTKCHWCGSPLHPEVNPVTECTECGAKGCPVCLPNGLCEECIEDGAKPSVVPRKEQ